VILDSSFENIKKKLLFDVKLVVSKFQSQPWQKFYAKLKLKVLNLILKTELVTDFSLRSNISHYKWIINQSRAFFKRKTMNEEIKKRTGVLFLFFICQRRVANDLVFTNARYWR